MPTSPVRKLRSSVRSCETFTTESRARSIECAGQQNIPWSVSELDIAGDRGRRLRFQIKTTKNTSSKLSFRPIRDFTKKKENRP